MEHLSSIFFTFLQALCIFFTLHLSKLFFFSTKNKKENKNPNLPPSPPSLPIIGHLHLLKKPLHQSLARLSARHGPLLLLHLGYRPALVVSSYSLAEECFTTNDLAFANRPKLPSIQLTTYNHTALANAVYGPEWRTMRRIAITEGLSPTRLAFFSSARAEEARALARNLFNEAKVDDFTKVELKTRLFGLAMNVMMRIINGKRYYGEDVEMNKKVKRFKKAVQEAFSIAGLTNLGDFLPARIRFLFGRRLKTRRAWIHDCRDSFIQSILDERRAMKKDDEVEEKKERNLADALLSMQKEQPEQYTDRFIKALIMSLLSAGTDTSSNTIEWTISLLLNNPEKLVKAIEEIDEQVGHKRLVEETDLINLPYLNCIINETLRLYPGAPIIVPHESREDCTVGGYHIASGTMLLVNAYAIQRDPKLWPEPTKFLPERFEDVKVDKMGNMLPFGMGRRKCPGEVLAMREIGLVIGILIQCFEWRRVTQQEVDMKEGVGIIMPRANSLEALCKPREPMINLLAQL